ncbi:hypothetical protein A3K73_08595 [Candidatus Pacearchaeota archaeon RBG_13_36_9]|nr:MAG: hypothetical protein A3K73_08595 [Candidatus Pacearchaeota archaeon RBG_13_36_9]HJX50463.1 hypothetical protein [Candidatus Nanoarchaeia archaeon]
MNKEIISRYLENKDNEKELFEYLKNKNKNFYEKKETYPEDDFDLLVRLIEEGNDNIKYYSIAIIKKVLIEYNSKRFNRISKIVIDNIDSNNGNIRHSIFMLLETMNSIIAALPMMTEQAKMFKAAFLSMGDYMPKDKINPFIDYGFKFSDDSINEFYESYICMFDELYNKFNESHENEKIQESILKSLSVMIIKIKEMAEFSKDEKLMKKIDKIHDLLNMGF